VRKRAVATEGECPRGKGRSIVHKGGGTLKGTSVTRGYFWESNARSTARARTKRAERSSIPSGKAFTSQRKRPFPSLARRGGKEGNIWGGKKKDPVISPTPSGGSLECSMKGGGRLISPKLGGKTMKRKVRRCLLLKVPAPVPPKRGSRRKPITNSRFHCRKRGTSSCEARLEGRCRKITGGKGHRLAPTSGWEKKNRSYAPVLEENRELLLSVKALKRRRGPGGCRPGKTFWTRLGVKS